MISGKKGLAISEMTSPDRIAASPGKTASMHVLVIVQLAGGLKNALPCLCINISRFVQDPGYGGFGYTSNLRHIPHARGHMIVQRVRNQDELTARRSHRAGNRQALQAER